MTFAEKVKYVRKKLMLSQVEFSKELGVAFTTINRWETGLREPNYSMQRKFVEFCNLNNITFDEKKN